MVEDIKLSFKGIWAHRMRSFLTMLGIIVGVAAVIAVVSTITGTNEQIKNNLIGDGTNTVTIQLYQNGWAADFSYSETPEGVPELTEKVRDDILKVDHVVNASLVHKREYVDNLYYLNNMVSGGRMYGIDENYFETAGYHVVLGRGFSKTEMEGQSKTVIIDDTLRGSIFGGENPLGKNIDINGEPFVVIGIVDKKSEFEPTINSVDDYYMYHDYSSGALYIPDNIWPLVFRYDEPMQVVVKADSTDNMTEVGNKCKDILNGTLTTTSSDIKYESTDLADAASQLQQLSSSANILLIGIASISLLVGGIGVMNIMLVSVTERTREIGIKKALGARKRRILRQFLMEAVILSGIGGILGVVAGIILSKIISLVALIPTAINPYAIIIAVAFSMVIGVVFGMVPSVKASKLNPIEALRYE